MGIILDMEQDRVQAQSANGETSLSSRLRQSRVFRTSTTAGSRGFAEISHSASLARQPNELAEGLGWGLGLGLSFWLTLGLLLRGF